MIHLISTDNAIGQARRDVLLPKLDVMQAEYCIHYGEADNGKPGFENEFNAWKTIISENMEEDYLIIMEDDCTFREDFSMAILQGFIDQCADKNIIALLTGCSQTRKPIPTDIEGLITVKTAAATQLAVIFKPCYQFLLDFPSRNHVDLCLTSLSQISYERALPPTEEELQNPLPNIPGIVRKPCTETIRYKIGLTLPYLTGQLKEGASQITGMEIGEIFEEEEQRLIGLLTTE